MIQFYIVNKSWFYKIQLIYNYIKNRMDKYTRIKMIGKGNFGDVWLVEDNKG